MFKPAVLTILFATAICFGFVVKPKEYSDSRIVGGTDAVEGQFPWMVSIRFRGINLHECGGSIINSKWILTAAHCLPYNDSEQMYEVIVGSILLSSGGTIHEISRIIYHEDYDSYANKNDVAVAELVVEIEFTEFVQPIELGAEFVDEVDSVLSGWGRLYRNGPTPDNLQYMNIRTMTLEACRQYPNYFYISDEEICTLSIGNELGFCNGDSGGPLVSDGKQIGIVSWGSLPCAFGNPEIYMRVSSFVEWINEAIST